MKSKSYAMNRREFVTISAMAGAGLLAASPISSGADERSLQPTSLIKGLQKESADSPLPEGVWYTAQNIGDGILYVFPKGTLASAKFLMSNFLVDGIHLGVFLMTLQEGEDGPAFGLRYKGLNQAQAFIRFPLDAVNQNRWRLEREGAWLKPTCEGDRVDLQNVDRMKITILHKSDQPVRWCQTPWTIAIEEPPLLMEPILPRGVLLDEMGQSTIHEWPGKSKSPEVVTQSLQDQFQTVDEKHWPERFSSWGGWKDKKRDGTGFFSTWHDGKRWWLLDPDGYAFWSTGPDCVHAGIQANCAGLESALKWKPESKAAYSNGSVDYLAANLIRAFGERDWYDKWAKISLSLLRDFGFNTVANWSDWKIAQGAHFPYVRPLSTKFPNTPVVFRDFPDVFHPNFAKDTSAFAEQLKETLDDPALIGYFLMNEPTWGFAKECPAEGMLFTTPECETRKSLSNFLRSKYNDSETLSSAWGLPASFELISKGEWKTRLTENARKDLRAFSEQMVTVYFRGISEACKSVDPHHLNLGIRYQGIPPQWAVPGMKYFDVFSVNCYQERVPLDTCKEIHDLLKMPILIGEFHFGALDVGLPSPGLVHVRSQEDRGRAYRYYVEDAAANPYCVGVHYFTLYDQSAMGRFDGENYNIGFLDICNRPYDPLVKAARITHETLYSVAAGDTKPFNDPPEYLPRLF